MGNPRKPRSGSMQFWPRVRAKRQHARVRHWAQQDKPCFLGFPVYKAGMTHAVGTDNRKTSTTKGAEVFYPLTVVETPPMRIFAIRFYHTPYNHSQPALEFSFRPSKDTQRTLTPAKKYADPKDLEKVDLSAYHEVTAIVHTQPRLIKLKKTPEFFEVHVGGSDLKTRFAFLKDNIGKDIHFKQVFDEGNMVDIHGVTTGKGTQGPVKRFGIALKPHKSEKSRRQPGSLGGWSGQGHVMYRVAHAGQMGYHQRVEYNKQLYRIGNKPEDINPQGGFLHYGTINSDYALVKGSLFGPAKRMLIFTKPIRQKVTIPAPTLNYVSIRSKQ